MIDGHHVLAFIIDLRGRDDIGWMMAFWMLSLIMLGMTALWGLDDPEGFESPEWKYKATALVFTAALPCVTSIIAMILLQGMFVEGLLLLMALYVIQGVCYLVWGTAALFTKTSPTVRRTLLWAVLSSATGLLTVTATVGAITASV